MSRHERFSYPETGRQVIPRCHVLLLQQAPVVAVSLQAARFLPSVAVSVCDSLFEETKSAGLSF